MTDLALLDDLERIAGRLRGALDMIDEEITALRTRLTGDIGVRKLHGAAAAAQALAEPPQQTPASGPPRTAGRLTLLTAIADLDGLLVSAEGRAQAELVDASGLAAQHAQALIRQMDADGLIDRNMLNARRCRAIRITELGWRMLGRERGPVAWPETDSTVVDLPERPPPPPPEPEPRAPSANPSSKDPAERELALLQRVAAAWNGASRKGPGERLTAVQRATQLPKSKANEAVQQARAFGLIASLPGPPEAA